MILVARALLPAGSRLVSMPHPVQPAAGKVLDAAGASACATEP